MINQRIAVIILCFTSIGWGITWLPIQLINEMGLATSHLILIAFSAASLALLPWIIKQRKQWLPLWPLMLLLGFLGGVANSAFQTALSDGDVIRVMILFYMLPLWSVIGGRFFLKEAIDARRLLALCLCIGGALCILQAWQTSWASLTYIDALALIAGMGLAASNILFRFTAQAPLTSKIGFMFIGCVVLVSFSLIIQQRPIIISQLPSNGAIPIAIAYGLVWIMLISFGSQWAVTRLEAGRSAVILVLELVAAALSVVIITRTGLETHEIIGGAMVLIAALLEGSRSEEKQ